MATLTRETSVHVSVDNGKSLEIFKVLKEAGVDPAVHLIAVQELPNRSWDITFKSVNTMRSFLPQLEHGCGFTTNAYSSSATVVNVLHVPHELQDSAVRYVLGKYGRVIAGRYKTFKDYPNVFNGIRQYRMILKQDIPSSLQLGGRNCWVRYYGQPRTCLRCGLKDHEVKDCKYIKCYRCQAFGHLTKDCSSEIMCSICEELGHSQSNCPISFANKVQPIPGKWQKELVVDPKQGDKAYDEPSTSLQADCIENERDSDNCIENKGTEPENCIDRNVEIDSESHGSKNKEDYVNMDCQEGPEYLEDTDNSSETEVHDVINMDSQDTQISQTVEEVNGGAELDDEGENSQLWYTEDPANPSTQLSASVSQTPSVDNPSGSRANEAGVSRSFSVGSNTPKHESREGRSIIRGSGSTRKRSASQPTVHKRKERLRVGNRFPRENPLDYIKMTQIFLEEEPWHTCVVKRCQANFSKYTDLLKHLSEIHPKEDRPQYSCVLHKTCTMLFTNPREWLVHIASSHPEFVSKKELEFFDRFYLKRKR